jgi:hypothetical protein
MIAWLIAGFSIVVYLAIGQAMAKLHAPRAWRAAQRIYSGSGIIRQSVHLQTMSMMFAWPFYQATLVVIFVVMSGYDVVATRASQIIDPHDPEIVQQREKEVERTRKIRELEYRTQINRLEREAGMRLTEWTNDV